MNRFDRQSDLITRELASFVFGTIVILLPAFSVMAGVGLFWLYFKLIQ